MGIIIHNGSLCHGQRCQQFAGNGVGIRGTAVIGKGGIVGKPCHIAHSISDCGVLPHTEYAVSGLAVPCPQRARRHMRQSLPESGKMRQRPGIRVSASLSCQSESAEDSNRSVFVAGPVRILVHAAPSLVITGFVLVIMGVGSLLHGQIEPVAGVAVRPDIHVGQQVVCILRDPIQHPVDHGHGLCAGDVGIGAESTVLKALDPAQLGGALNVSLRPVALNVGKGLAALGLAVVKAGADGGKLGAGDGRIGIEGRCRAALNGAQTRHGRDGGVGPVVIRHIGVGVAGEEVAVPDGILQQTEEDSGGLRAGDQAIGAHIAVLVADDVGKMLLIIEPVRGRAAGVGHGDGLLLRADDVVLHEIIDADIIFAAALDVTIGGRQLPDIEIVVFVQLVVHPLVKAEACVALAAGGSGGNLLVVHIQAELCVLQSVAVLCVHLLDDIAVSVGIVVAGGGLLV